MPSRTRSTVCPSVITPVRVRGAAPKTAAAVSPGAAASSPSRNQSTKPWMPAWRICPTQERLSAVRSPNQGMSVSIRDMAALLREPVERRSAAAARSRDASWGSPAPLSAGSGTAATVTARP